MGSRPAVLVRYSVQSPPPTPLLWLILKNQPVFPSCKNYRLIYKRAHKADRLPPIKIINESQTEGKKFQRCGQKRDGKDEGVRGEQGARMQKKKKKKERKRKEGKTLSLSQKTD